MENWRTWHLRENWEIFESGCWRKYRRFKYLDEKLGNLSETCENFQDAQCVWKFPNFFSSVHTSGATIGQNTEIGKWSLSGRKSESEFSAIGRPKCLKNPEEKLSAPLVQSSEEKFTLQVKIFEFYPSGPKCRDGTLHSAECHLGTSELCTSGA